MQGPYAFRKNYKQQQWYLQDSSRDFQVSNINTHGST